MNKLIALVAIAGAFAVGPQIRAQASGAPLPASERPVKPEKNPPGDIPDNQVFIEYRSPQGFSIKVPEGWARRETSDGATFNDKYNTITLAASSRVEQMTLRSAKQHEVSRLEAEGRAVRVTKIGSVPLPSGPAIVVSYGSNSDPNPITDKAIRLENARYFFWKNGKLVSLTLSAPYGADNADQWKLMSRSFRWR